MSMRMDENLWIVATVLMQLDFIGMADVEWRTEGDSGPEWRLHWRIECVDEPTEMQMAWCSVE